MLTYHAEMEFACLYALRKPELAKKCARSALTAARALGNPSLVYEANYLLATLGG